MKRVLLVGINYLGSPNQLKGCVEDITNMYDFLKNDNHDIHILTDGLVHGKKYDLPTKDNIVKEIKWLVENLTSDCVFYYSGHGASITDSSKDEKDTLDEVLVPVDYLKNGVITDDYIHDNLVLKVPKGCKLWGFVDACNSGSIFDLENTVIFTETITQIRKRRKKVKKIISNFIYSNEKSGKEIPKGEIIVFSGCKDDQVSTDAFINGVHRGAFSYCLFETLKNPSVKTMKVINVLKNINQILKTSKFTQISQLSVSYTGNFETLFDI